MYLQAQYNFTTMINNLTSEGPNNPVKKKNNETIVVKDKRSGGKIPGLAFPGRASKTINSFLRNQTELGKGKCRPTR